jgi:hypothetical protein
MLSDIRDSASLFEGSQASSDRPSDTSNIQMVSMEYWRNDDRRKPKYSEENLPQCHSLSQISPRIGPG